MLESKFQAELIDKLYKLFPGCVIQKNDPAQLQGIPDLTIYYGKCWAMLEVKGSATALERPNQDWFVESFNSMSFAAFIYPENEQEILNELQRAFGSCG